MKAINYTVSMLASRIKGMRQLRDDKKIDISTYNNFIDSLDYLFEERFVTEALVKSRQ